QAKPARTLDEYRHFRALSIDLLGRAPRREEIAAFERPAFDLDAWIEKLLQGPGYADRLSRVSIDLLRLELGPALTHPPRTTSRWMPEVRDPDPLFQPIDELFKDPDGSPAMKVRVCKEEASTADAGTVFVAKHPVLPPVMKDGKPTPAIPPGRFRPYPGDDAY